MSAVTQLLAGSTSAGVSAVSLLLLDKYNMPNETVLSMDGVMRAGVQFLSSLWQNIVLSWLRPFLPQALQLSPLFLKPVIVGVQFAFFEMLVNGEGIGAYYQYNFITSTLSEAAAQLISPSVSQFLPGTSLSPTPLSAPSLIVPINY